jgi:hypothetical protein
MSIILISGLVAQTCDRSFELKKGAKLADIAYVFEAHHFADELGTFAFSQHRSYQVAGFG